MLNSLAGRRAISHPSSRRGCLLASTLPRNVRPHIRHTLQVQHIERGQLQTVCAKRSAKRDPEPEDLPNDLDDLPFGDDLPDDLDDLDGADFDDDALDFDAEDLNLEDFQEGPVEDDEGQDEAGGAVDDSEGKYPPRPERSFFLADLFGWAAYYDKAEEFEQTFPEVGVYGLQSDASRIKQGDMYCCSSYDPEKLPSLVSQALANGAHVLVLPSFAEHMPDVASMIPSDVPALYVDAVDELATRLSVAFYGAPSRDMLMVGVVGCHGKTTTSWLVRGILEEMNQVSGMIGDVEVAIAEDRLDVDGNLWKPSSLDPTEKRDCSAPFMVTPYPEQAKYNVPDGGLSGLQTQKVLSGMKDRGATCCVLEASPATAASGRLAFVETNVMVHTTLQITAGTSSDASSGTTMASAKQEELQDQLLVAAVQQFERLEDPNAQAVVINLDDPFADIVQAAASSVPAVTYAIENQSADVVCIKADFTTWESELIIKTPGGNLQIITPLLGRHNVYNILAAVATGLALKVPLKSIVAGIEAVEIIPGRSEVVDEGQDFSVIVDSADTPQAIGEMLRSLRAGLEPKGKIITVFGCRGEEDKTQRPLIAETVHNLSDMVIFTNDSPRREAPEDIIQDLVAGLPDNVIKRYSGYVYFPFQDQGHVPLWFEPYLQKAQQNEKRYIMEDRFSAIRAAIGAATEKDVVLIAGRGHIDYMEYEDGEGGIVKGWFDDRVEARSALSKLSYLNQLTKLSRKQMPWGRALDDMDSLVEPPEIGEDDTAAELAGAA